jgi:predicted small lipoprotein YifL
MDQLNRYVMCFLLLALAGCGVKGRPLPPLNPATLGRGEPTYSEATKKKPNKKNSSKSQDQDESSLSEDER